MEAQTGVRPSAVRPPTPGEAPTIAIAYETFGDPSDPAVLLVMGFGTQMLGWDADFCRLLAARGRYVIRYDNRDCGLSTKLDEHPLNLGDFIAAVTSGDLDRALAMAPYSLCDMARDGITVLDRLGVAAAERELVWVSRRYGDAAALRSLAAASYDRAYYPAGVPRQLAAIILDGSRAEALTTLEVPTLVVHGLDDTLIDPSGGRRTAELVPGSRLLLVQDMGHDRPPALWPHLVDAIATHTASAEASPGSHTRSRDAIPAL
jgi:pimeloyl-ACP methyl ester carboxylesterase